MSDLESKVLHAAAGENRLNPDEPTLFWNIC